MARFTTKELSKKTWPDYVRFFSQGNGWDHCGCTAYQGFRAPHHVRKWADKRDWILKVKCDLVERRRAHGILVYDGTEPIGWCQFGPKGELPILDNRRTFKLFPDDSEEREWKITCFCTHKDYRQQGVAGIALHAALDSIRRKGGGLVEAYPFAHAPGDPESDERRIRIKQWWKTIGQLERAHGKRSEKVRRFKLTAEPRTGLDRAGGGGPLVVEGVGSVNGMYWVAHCGTAAMFEREGFKAISVVPVSERIRSPGPHPSRLVMQKTI